MTTYMERALENQRYSTCMRRQVGAVLLLRSGKIIDGHNGSPFIFHDCSKIGCNREGLKSGTNLDRCYALHAETMCISSAARQGLTTEESSLYCTHLPCLDCAKQIVNAGVTSVHYLYEYPSDSIKLLTAQGIEVIQEDATYETN